MNDDSRGRLLIGLFFEKERLDKTAFEVLQYAESQGHQGCWIDHCDATVRIRLEPSLDRLLMICNSTDGTSAMKYDSMLPWRDVVNIALGFCHIHKGDVPKGLSCSMLLERLQDEEPTKGAPRYDA